MTWLTEKVIEELKSNLAPKRSTLKKWDHAGAYFRSFGAKQSGVLEAAYHAIKKGQSFSITLTTEEEFAQTGGDTARRVYHGTSMAAALLIVKGGFSCCALMEASVSCFLPCFFFLTRAI